MRKKIAPDFRAETIQNINQKHIDHDTVTQSEWPDAFQLTTESTTQNGSFWLDELKILLVRFSDIGITPNIAMMTLRELRGIYRYLTHLAEA